MTCLFTKVFSAPNCGATYLEKLVNKNFATDLLRGDFGVDKRVLRMVLQSHKARARPAEASRLQDQYHERILYSDFGLKHAAPPLDVIRATPHSGNTVFLMVTKHPVFFLTSLHARPKNSLLGEVPQTFEKFIEMPWPVASRDNLGSAPLASPIEVWNRMAQAYLKLLSVADNALILRYEDLLTDFDTQMERIADYIPKTGNAFGGIQRSIRASDNLRFDDYVRRYKYQRIKADHAKRDLEYIYRKVDGDALQALGYREVI